MASLGRPSADRRPARALALLVGLAGAGLCALALPAAGARLAELVGRPAFERIAEGGRLSAEGYRRLLAANDAARSWLAEPRLSKDLAIALHGIATREPDLPMPAVALLLEARASLAEALEEAPADPAGWLQLARLDAALLDLARAAAALRVSQRVGPVAPELAVPRAALALGLWEWLAEPVREQAGGELARAFRAEPGTIALVAARTGRLVELRARLAGDPAALAALESELAALRRAAAPAAGGSG